jgi:hypothetical protein
LNRSFAGVAQEVEQDLPQPHGIGGKGAEVVLDLGHQAVFVLLQLADPRTATTTPVTPTIRQR